MSDLWDSYNDPCLCGRPCELFRRYAAMEQASALRGPRADDPPTLALRFEGGPVKITEELTYRSYYHNRRYGVTPEHWQRAFPRADVEAMEQRYQAEWAEQDKARHEAIERISARPIPPFEATR